MGEHNQVSIDLCHCWTSCGPFRCRWRYCEGTIDAGDGHHASCRGSQRCSNDFVHFSSSQHFFHGIWIVRQDVRCHLLHSWNRWYHFWSVCCQQMVSTTQTAEPNCAFHWIGDCAFIILYWGEHCSDFCRPVIGRTASDTQSLQFGSLIGVVALVGK